MYLGNLFCRHPLGAHCTVCLPPGGKQNYFFTQMLFLVGQSGERCEELSHGLFHLRPEKEQHISSCHVAETVYPHSSKTVILLVIDRSPKAARFIALNKLPTASETAKILVNHVFRLRRIRTEIVSDRGPQFVPQAWKVFSCSSLGAKVCLSCGFNFQTNGHTERLRQELEAALQPQPITLPLGLLSCPGLVADNFLTSLATGQSPLKASVDYEPSLFSSTELDLTVRSVQLQCQQVCTSSHRL